MTTLNIASNFFVEDCIYQGCDAVFAMTTAFVRKRRNDHQNFYCPNGHPMVYNGRTDGQLLADEKARNTALRDQLAAAIRDNENTRAALLRDRARFAAGVCPCCNRSFDNVRRHMRSQHPDYDVTRIDKHAPLFKCSCGSRFESYRGLRTHQGHMRRHTGTYAWDKPDQSRYFAHLTEVKV